MATRHYVPKGPYDFSREYEALSIAEKAKEEEKESSEYVNKIMDFSSQAIPSTMNVLSAVDKIQTAKLTDSEIMEMVDSSGNPLFIPNDVNVDAFTIDDPSFVSREVASSSADWTSRLIPNPDSEVNAEDLQKMLKERNIDDKTISKIISTEKPLSSLGQVSEGIEKGLNPSNFLSAFDADVSKSQKLGFALGKAGLGLQVGSGIYKAGKGISEGEPMEVIHGAIQAATPWLMAAGPITMGVAAINTVWDLFD